jgi:dipeptidyl aminopeptidase/acylaminoacyl peptidase
VLFIHGGPFTSSLDADHVRWSPHLLAAPGYVVLLVDYTGSVGYGAEFSRNIEGDPLATPGEELIEAAEEATRTLRLHRS